MPSTVTVDYKSLLSRLPEVDLAAVDVIEPLSFVGAAVDGLGLDGSGKGLGPRVENVWRHSVAVGVAANRLCQMSGVQGVACEGYFVGGALHDLGRVVLMRLCPDAYRRVLEFLEEDDREAFQVEREVLGFDHARLGADVARRWGLSDDLCDLIRHHHEGVNEDASLMLRLVCVANRCVKAMGFGSDVDGCHGIDGAWLTDAKFGVVDLPDLLAGLEEEAGDLGAVLGV
ncbi:MAG: HDOD domain-containing protein [Planctomycetota bacterium]